MDRERWEHLERLYHAALARSAEERAAFLAETCAGDEGLQRDVESLLAQATSEGILAGPAVAAIPDLAASDARGLHPDLRSGTLVGPYRIDRLLGRGGMGQVYRAHDTKLRRDVAIKVLPAESLSDAMARARFLREARAAAALNHPHICTIHEIGEAEGRTYIAMELIEGRTLSARLSEGPVPADEAVRYGVQLTEALAHAHERGVMHRDLKSDNIVITPDGRAKVLDFGLAKRLSANAVVEVTTHSQALLTQSGALMGTLAYMAPEQLRGHPADTRSDVWALGVVLYEMATGGRPFQGRTGFELSAAILSQAPAQFSLPIPVALQAVIERCLEKEPEQRYQRAADVRAALEAIQNGTTPASAASRSRARSRRLAVLPLHNLSRDPEQDYFVDGTHEALITDLARISTLRVIARPSVMRFKGTDSTLVDIARQLKVEALLTGSVMRVGDRVRITVQLIDAVTEEHLWAGRYERGLRDVLSVQNEIVGTIAREIELQLTPQEQARLARVRPVNPEAYEAYLKGISHWSRLTRADMDVALRYFELALQKDPSYALAYVGIGKVWAARQQMGLAAPSEATAAWKAATAKVLELDVALFEGHYMLAVQSTWADWDWAGGEAEFARTFDLNPNHAEARAAYSHLLMILKRPTEAMPQIEQALELDPLNPLIQGFYGVDLLILRQYDDAIARFNEALKTAAGMPLAYRGLQWAFFKKRMPEEALAATRSLLRAQGFDAVEAALAFGYTEGGYSMAIRRAADAFATQVRTQNVASFDLVSLYVFLGDHDQAMEWLERAYELHEPNMPYIGVSPHLDELRGDPRFQDLMRRMRLPA